MIQAGDIIANRPFPPASPAEPPGDEAPCDRLAGEDRPRDGEETLFAAPPPPPFPRIFPGL